MEVRLRDQAAGAAELKVQVDQYKRRVIEVEGEAAAAEDVSAPEHDRLRADNRRLVARVVSTSTRRNSRSFIISLSTQETPGFHRVDRMRTF